MKLHSWVDPENSVRGVLTTMFSHQRVSHRTVRGPSSTNTGTDPLEKQMDPLGPIAFRGGSVPVFRGVQLLFEGVRSNISKETYSHSCFSR